MNPLAIGGDDRRTFVIAVATAVAAAVLVVIATVSTPKVGFYVDSIERSGLLYAVLPLAVAGLTVVLKYPRLSVYIIAFLLPFNAIGGGWGEQVHVTLGKLALNLAVLAGIFSTVLAPRADRAWITTTRLGHALLAWLLLIAVAIAVGFFSSPNRGDWLRETSWMVLYVGALPVGTLLRDRRDLARMLASGAAGVAIMQVIAFWMLATGHRFDRPDVQGGEAFFRAPFAAFCVFYLLLAQAIFFFGTATPGALTRRQRALAFAAVAVLSAGLLATMGRGLWISAIAGTAVLLWFAPWKASMFRAVALTAGGVAVAVGLVVLVDGLSPESRGNWTRLAVDFFFALGEKQSVTTLSRQLEWLHAIDVWKMSPVVGYGFGYPFPDNPYNVQTADAFYMHNSYFNVLAKCGALGVLALLWLLWVTGVRLVRSCHAATRFDDRVVAATLLAGVVQMAVLSFIVPAMTTTDSVLAMGALFGLTAAHGRMLARREVT